MDQEYLRDITKESNEYRNWKSIFESYTDLYAGGAQFKAKANQYLYRRHREPGEIFGERAERAFYENYIGSIIDWYASTLFRREALFTVDEATKNEAQFYFGFLQNCDRNGTGISDFFRKRFCEALVYGRSYVCLEFPLQTTIFANRSEELKAGADRPYLVGYTPVSTLSKRYDDFGKLEQITFIVSETAGSGIGEAKAKKLLAYDQENFYLIAQDESTANKEFRILSTGRHSCASQLMPPVFELEVSEGMWLMNKAASLQLEHYNKSNSLAWSLGMALYATPVIYSKKDWSKMLGESYYIHLDPEDKFGWTEPEGNVYKIAMDNLNRLQEEIYRTCYVLNQSKSWLGGSKAESASSKKQDYQITQEVLRAYGDNVKDCLKKVLHSVVVARKDRVALTVGGLDQFEVGELKEELDDAKALLALGIESQTFKRQLFKRLALKLLSDSNELTKNRIASEIDETLVEKEEPKA